MSKPRIAWVLGWAIPPELKRGFGPPEAERVLAAMARWRTRR